MSKDDSGFETGRIDDGNGNDPMGGAEEIGSAAKRPRVLAGSSDTVEKGDDVHVVSAQLEQVDKCDLAFLLRVDVKISNNKKASDKVRQVGKQLLTALALIKYWDVNTEVEFRLTDSTFRPPV